MLCIDGTNYNIHYLKPLTVKCTIIISNGESDAGMHYLVLWAEGPSVRVGRAL